ncbi:YaiI/YqxD family protein [Saccharophagus sp. K07]|jgi:uncharacterized protein YaiI (UPF0178 family)|uniref:YaiI/YqxD family protein n=1 Tax=Saccharophagus sp. K07 TaxID=2283636 RepID=UPI0016528EF5|nr:YaiI/YqxD family protein [Saccharophagus sp. K07]MBC6905409.1 YaiI/YqxD family protein [Saccharophagus sp. K07]
MTIWVDADACPVAAKEILFRAAVRTETPVVLVANQYMRVPPSPFIKSIQVVSGFDVADNEIAQNAQAGDLVVTSDIPLAAEVVAKQCVALNPRGELYTKENIRSRLNMRDFMETLRSSGIQTGGSPPYDQTDRQKFANQLDAYLARQKNKRG